MITTGMARDPTKQRQLAAIAIALGLAVLALAAGFLARRSRHGE